MSVLLTTYGGTYGTGLSLAERKANRTALTNALNAAVATDDELLLTGRYEICCEPRDASLWETNATTLAQAAAVVTTAGTVRITGTDSTTCILDIYLDYSAGATKIIDNSSTPSTMTSGTAVGSITESGVETLTVPGETFITKGVAAGDTLILAGWPGTNHDGTFTILNVTGETTLRYSNGAASGSVSADADSTYEVQTVPADRSAAIIACATDNVQWELTNIKFEGPTDWSDATQKDLGAVYGLWHNANGGTNNITVTGVVTTGLLQTFLQRAGACVFTITESDIAGHMACITMFDDKANEGNGSTAGRELRSSNNTFDGQGILAAESSDGQDHGIAFYIHPHTAFISEDDEFIDCYRVAIKQYSQSDGVDEDFEGFTPQVTGEDTGVGGLLRNATVTSAEAHRIIETTDGDCTVIIEGLTFGDANTDGGSIYPRCTNFIIRDCTDVPNVRFLGMGTVEARQTTVNVLLQNYTFTESRTTGTWIDTEAGWCVTLDNVQGTWSGVIDSNTFAMKGPKAAADGNDDGSLTVEGDCVFAAPNGNANGDVFRIQENVPAIFEGGVTATGGWRSLLNLFTSGQCNVQLRGDGPNCTGLTLGSVVFFQTDGSGTPLTDSISGPLGQCAESATQMAVRSSNATGNPAQNLRLRNFLDPTTRNASTNILKVHANYSASTANGVVATFRSGLGTQDASYAFDGQRYRLISGPLGTLTINSSGNITPLAGYDGEAQAAGTELWLQYDGATNTWIQIADPTPPPLKLNNPMSVGGRIAGVLQILWRPTERALINAWGWLTGKRVDLHQLHPAQ
jgi:hypothetical protein